MLACAIAFGIAGLATATAFLASYAAENGLPFEVPTLHLPRAAPVAPMPLAPVWCEAARRWRHPVTRAFVKAPVLH